MAPVGLRAGGGILDRARGAALYAGPGSAGCPRGWLGAAFYTGLVGVAACALRAWSQSLLPGYLATLVFFLAYRALGH